jgi:hypothetical protein
MNWQLVVVKDISNTPRLVRVCHTKGNLAFVTSEKVFNQIKNGDTELFPIGFSLENVFAHDGDLPKRVNWGKMGKWIPD